MLKIKNKRFLLLLAASLIVLLGELSERSGSQLYLIIALTMTAACSFICSKESLFAFVLLLVAPNRILTLGPISAPTIVMMVGTLRTGLHRNIKIKASFFLGAMLLVFESIFTYITGDSQVLSSIKILIVLYFITTYTNTANMRVTHERLVDACSTGCVVTSILTVLLNPSSIYENYRFSLTGSGGENVLGILCCIMALNLLCIVLYDKRNKKARYFVYIAILGLVALLTGSRSALICILVGLIGIFIVACFRRNFRQAFVMILLAAMVGVIIYYSMYYSDNLLSVYIERFIYRAQKRAGNDISNGRYNIWKMYFDVFRNHPALLWLGGMNYTSYGIQVVAHNMIIEQLAAHGIIGSIIVVGLYYNAYVSVKRASNSKAIVFSAWAVPFVALMVVSMFSHTLLGVPQTMMLYLSLYGILEGKQ